MHHLAIMKASWGLIPKIVSGQKTIESRWYLNKSAPWDKIRAGDTVYFKDSGQPVTLSASVARVEQFSALTPQMVGKILQKYGQKDGILPNEIPKYYHLFKSKRYCILIFLQQIKEIVPFNINKSGFGTMSAWLCLDNIDQIRL